MRDKDIPIGARLCKPKQLWHNNLVIRYYPSGGLVLLAPNNGSFYMPSGVISSVFEITLRFTDWYRVMCFLRDKP